MSIRLATTTLKSIRFLRLLSTKFRHRRLLRRQARAEKRLALLQKELRHQLLVTKELEQLLEMEQHRETELSPVPPVPVILRQEPEFRLRELEFSRLPLEPELDHPLLLELLNLPPQENSEDTKLLKSPESSETPSPPPTSDSTPQSRTKL